MNRPTTNSLDRLEAPLKRTISSAEVRAHLPRLLDEVAEGKTITITKHGVPVAKLVPAGEARRTDVSEVIEALRELRKRIKPLGDESVRDLIEEGRRY
jgi:prevent-host-death family protein